MALSKMQQLKAGLAEVKNYALGLFGKLEEQIESLGGEAVSNFDNLLAFPGCTRLTPEKNENTYTEQIVTTEGEVLRAERITVINDDGSYTETYNFYEDDGETVKEQYTVQTTKDANGTWRETVTKGGDVT